MSSTTIANGPQERTLRFEWVDETHTCQDMWTHPDCTIVGEIRRVTTGWQVTWTDGPDRSWWEMTQDAAIAGGLELCLIQIFPTLEAAQAFAHEHIAQIVAGVPATDQTAHLIGGPPVRSGAK